MAAKTQCHGHMPLSGRRFGSFAGKTTFSGTTDTWDASQFSAALETVSRHQFPRSSSQFGNPHHAFSFFPWFVQAGA